MYEKTANGASKLFFWSWLLTQKAPTDESEQRGMLYDTNDVLVPTELRHCAAVCDYFGSTHTGCKISLKYNFCERIIERRNTE